MRIIFKRKLIAASFTCSLYTILLGLLVPDLIDSKATYFQSVITSISIYFLYTIPAIFVYGLFTSFVSDKIGELFARKTGENNFAWHISLLLHLLFGSVLLFISLPAALLFYLIDRLLRKKDRFFTWTHSLLSIALPIFLWLLTMVNEWFSIF
ncbi:hypothetical protein [Niallia sp. FSL W8-1348]|uniref:hypothetical protein n=1 Tax=Niallia sp. FSL W8-1348 TaxID=2954656 RepID=UPI0003328950|nr:hypothetical protein A499_13716 [Niallia nealsonii AAU1]